MGDLRTIGKGAVYVLFGMAFSKVAAYLWRIIVARIGPEDYGLISIALSVFGIAYTLSFLGLDSAVLRFMAYFHGKNDLSRMKGVITSSLKITVPVSLGVSAILFLSSEFIAISIFGNSRLAPLFKIMSLGVAPYVVYGISLSILTALKRVDYTIFSRNIVESGIRLIATILLLYWGYGFLGVAVAYVAAFFFSAAASLYFLEKEFPFLKSRVIATSVKKELLNYSIPLLMGGIIAQVLSWTDILMLGYFRTPYEVGIYNTAAPTAALIFIASNTLTTLFLPVISIAYAKNLMSDIRRIYLKVTKLIIVTALPLLLIMIFFSGDILGFFFGRAYVEGALAVSFLSIAYFISSAVMTSNAILDMVKKTKHLMTISIIATVMNAILNYFLIPTYGINGAAFATLISMTLGSLLISFFAYKSMNMIPYDLSVFYVSALGAVSLGIMYFGLHAAYSEIPTMPAVIGISFFFLVYAYFVFRFNIIERREVLEIIKILKSKMKLKSAPAIISE